jgi:hypothetical protein
MRYKTAAILSAIVIGVFFGFPAAVEAVFLPSLRLGIPKPVPGYERLLLGAASVCREYGVLVVPPLVAILFAAAFFTQTTRTVKATLTRTSR